MDALIEANCLGTEELIPGTILYVPGIPPTESPIQCGPPPGWIFYTVRPGDTLYHIGLAFGVSVTELQIRQLPGRINLDPRRDAYLRAQCTHAHTHHTTGHEHTPPLEYP